jgi:addiction module RelE/StbE family toxin
MKVYFKKRFKKQYEKLHAEQRKKCDQRVMLFIKDPYNSLLNNHALDGEYKKYRSIDITGDIRALYEPIAKNTAYFILVDTHSNLYS